MTPPRPTALVRRSPALLVLGLLLSLLVAPSASGEPGAGGSLGTAPPPAATAGVDGAVAARAAAAIDANDRAAVEAAYLDVYRPAAAVAAPPVDPALVAACQAGSPSAPLQAATLDLVNYFRAMSQVGPVTFDPSLSAKAQQAALMMYANDALDHAPPTSWDCYSAEGADAAGSSNLARGYSGADVVQAYMDDPGATNTGAGHRYWLQRPTTQTMGNGMVGDANALWVFGAEAPTTGPTYTTWPSAGFFPAPLEPNGRWSFTPWDPAHDLSLAPVSVTDETDADVPVTVHPREAWGSLVFELGDLPDLTGADDRYTVTINDILHGTEVLQHQYSVTLFDPVEPAITAVAAPTISGTARVGSTLTAGAPTWSTTGVATSYQWLRDGRPINNATGPKRTLISTDVGTTITVRATGTKTGFTAGSAVSAATAKVTKITPVVTVRGSSTRVGALRLAITVSAAPDAPPSGTVSVRQGTTLLRAKLPLTSGQAVYTATGIKPGRYTYSVRFPGTIRIASATKTTTVTIKAKARPTITLRPRTAPAKVTIGIAVTAPGQPALGGTVFVKEGTKTLRSGIKVIRGKATWSASGVRSGSHTYRVGYNGTSQVTTGSKTVTVKVPPPVKLVSYADCTALRKVHPHGVGRSGAKDRTSGTPVTTFLVHTALYQRNDGQTPRYSGEKDLDRDNDGIACERA